MEMNGIALTKQLVERIANKGELSQENAKAIQDVLELTDKYFTAYHFYPNKYSWQFVRDNAEKFPTHSQVQRAMFEETKKKTDFDGNDFDSVLAGFYPKI